jgi:hypothetical protein
MSELPLLAPTESDQGVHNANNQLLRGALGEINETLDGGLTPADNLTQSAWTAFTPTVAANVSGPTLGTGSQAFGYYTRQADRLIVARYLIVFGTAGVSAGNGFYQITTPVSMAIAFGTGITIDNSTGFVYQCIVRPWSNDSFLLHQTVAGAAATYYTNAYPFVWAASDMLFQGGITGEATS